MNRPELEEHASRVLVLHQRTETSGCMCGQLRLGESHSKHLIEVLRMNGFYLQHGQKEADNE